MVGCGETEQRGRGQELENLYDDDAFFAAYAQMDRSKRGLEGAGEWYELQKLLPDFTDTRVLDLGCGYGWHCAYAAQHGARYVLGTDLSERMLATGAINAEQYEAYERRRAAKD